MRRGSIVFEKDKNDESRPCIHLGNQLRILIQCTSDTVVDEYRYGNSSTLDCLRFESLSEGRAGRIC